MEICKNQADETAITPFAKCPSCQQNFMLEIRNGEIITNARNCKFCNSWIDEARIVLSYSNNLIITEALQLAGEVRGFNYSLPIILGLGAFEMLICFMVADTFPFLAHIMLVVSTLYILSGFVVSNNWLKKYKNIRIYDSELITSKKSIFLSRTIWIAGLVINSVIWLSFLMYLRNKQY